MTEDLRPKFHLFKKNERRIVFDCYTFATFLVDDLAYHALSLYEQKGGDRQAVQGELCKQYKDEAVRDVLQEIEMLRAGGYLVNNDDLPLAPRTDPDSVKRLGIGSITLMLTQTCNLRCEYCYGDVGSYETYPAFMSEEIAKRAIDFLMEKSGGDAELYRVSFFGGEPLFNFELLRKVVAYCGAIARDGSTSFFYTITTNGTLLTDEVLTFLSEHDVGIILSVDGPREIHDTYRCFPNGKGSFDLVLEAARRIASFERPLWVRATLTRQSPPLSHLIRFFEHEVGANSILISPMMEVSDSETLSAAEVDLQDLLPQQIEVSKQSLRRFAEGEAVPYNPMLTPLHRLHLRRGAIFTCSAGRGMSSVATNGDIYPCHRFVGLEAFVVGNVKEGIYPEKLAAFFNNFDDASKKCKSCWAYYLCAGGCPRRRALEDGTFAPPDQKRCDYYRAFHETVIGIYAELQQSLPDFFEKELPPKYPVRGLRLAFV